MVDVKTKAERRSNFQTKNERRKKARTFNPHKYAEGRFNRRELASCGAFGQEIAKIYNLCVLGTGGVERSSKKAKEDFETNSDYDQ